MWSLVNVTEVPIRSPDRLLEAGLSASLPRNAFPRMLVIRIDSVSRANGLVTAKTVSRTESPT